MMITNEQHIAEVKRLRDALRQAGRELAEAALIIAHTLPMTAGVFHQAASKAGAEAEFNKASYEKI